MQITTTEAYSTASSCSCWQVVASAVFGQASSARVFVEGTAGVGPASGLCSSFAFGFGETSLVAVVAEAGFVAGTGFDLEVVAAVAACIASFFVVLLAITVGIKSIFTVLLI